MSPLVKHLCKIRNKSVRKGVNEELQRKINKLIRENMVSEVKKENGKYASGSKKWWDTVNKITGRKANHTSINIDPSVINSYFQTINTKQRYSTCHWNTKVPPSYGNQPILIQYLRKPPSRNVPN